MGNTFKYGFKFSIGETEYELIRFQGEEGLSRDFKFVIEFVGSKSSTIVTDGILDVSCKLEFYDHRVSSNPQRVINGIVVSFETTGIGYGDDKYAVTYRVVMCSALYRLGMNLNYRIFQETTVEDTIKTIMGDHENVVPYTPVYHIVDSHSRRELITQYKESDLGFIGRLMSEEGIFYWITSDQVIFSDLSFTKYLGEKDISIGGIVLFRYIGSFDVGSSVGLADKPRITSFGLHDKIRPDTVVIDSYNHTSSRDDLSKDVVSDMPRRHIKDKYVLHVRDGVHEDKNEGWRKAKVITGSYDAEVSTMVCKSDIMALESGAFMRIRGHDTSEVITDTYYVTSISHFAEISASAGGKMSYSNDFSLNQKDIPYRSRVLPKPVVHGLEIGVVMGNGDNPDSERNQIHCDEEGRVLIRFNWALSQEYIDRSYARKERKFRHSSWIRSTQMFTGGNWGSIAIPRVGEEVLVSFLQGDPDRPVIVGRVYNDFSTAPYSLPAHKTKTVIRTATVGASVSNGVASRGFNELSFDDKEKNERIFLRAEKDLAQEVLNDSMEIIKNNKTVNVTSNYTSSVGMNETHNIGSSLTVNVGDYAFSTVKGANTLTVMGANTLTVMGANLLNVAGVNNVIVGGAQTEQVAGIKSSVLLGNYVVSVMGSYTSTAKKTYNLTVDENMGVTVAKDSKEMVHGNKYINVISDAASNYNKDYTIIVEGRSNEKVIDRKYIEAKTMVQNIEEEIIIKAKKILLEADGNIVELGSGGITLISKADFKAKGTSIDLASSSVKIGGSASGQGATIEEELELGFTQFKCIDKTSGVPLANMNYKIVSGGAVVDKGVTSGDGYTMMFKIEDGKSYECVVETYPG